MLKVKKIGIERTTLDQKVFMEYKEGRMKICFICMKQILLTEFFISENLSHAESLFDIVELIFEILFCKISMVK